MTWKKKINTSHCCHIYNDNDKSPKIGWGLKT